MHRGHAFNEAPMRFCTGAMSSTRPRCTHAQGHEFNEATLLKAWLGPNSSMAWVLQELRLHQQAEREWVPWELLG